MQSSDNNISTIISQRNWDALNTRFDRMTNSEFRRVQQVVRVQILPHLPNSLFWDAYLHLLTYRLQSFLSSILAIHRLAQSGELSFDCREASDTAQWLHRNAPDAIVKVIRMALPKLTSSEQMVALQRWLDYTDYRELTSILTHETTPQAYHALFLMLKYEADNQHLLRTVCLNLLRKGDDLSFNMASIIRSYFDIKDINSTLSLQIEPYELSYIDQSYDSFLHVIKGKRPQVL